MFVYSDISLLGFSVNIIPLPIVCFVRSTGFPPAKSINGGVTSSNRTKRLCPDEVAPEDLKFKKAKNAKVLIAPFIWGDSEDAAPEI